MEASSPHQRCVIARFRADSRDFVVGAPYVCDVPCKGSGNRLTQACGRVIVPEILENGDKGYVPDSFSPRCAVAAGTVLVINSMDTGESKYL